LGKPKALQVKEEKVLMEYIVSVMVRIMSLSGTNIGGGNGMSHQVIAVEGDLIRTSERERVFRGRMNLSCSEGGRLGMLMT
jgi:hypothetical protein